MEFVDLDVNALNADAVVGPSTELNSREKKIRKLTENENEKKKVQNKSHLRPTDFPILLAREAIASTKRYFMIRRHRKWT